MTAVLFIHEPGDVAGGAPWRDALADHGVVAPDLPGHGTAPPPVSGHYELYDVPVYAAAWAKDGVDTVVGVGRSGWVAQLLGIGGLARRVVVVDGLGGPWRSGRESIAAGVRWIRAIADDPEALAPPPSGRPDVARLRHGVGPMASRSMAEKLAAVMPVPVVAVETPSSPLDPDDAAELVGRFAAGGELVRLDSRDPAVLGSVL